MSERKYFSPEPVKEQPKQFVVPDGFSPKKAPVRWNVLDLSDFFAIVKLPEAPVMLDKTTKIIDTKLFVKSHLRTVQKHNGNKTFFPYYERLQQLKKIIENGITSKTN